MTKLNDSAIDEHLGFCKIATVKHSYIFMKSHISVCRLGIVRGEMALTFHYIQYFIAVYNAASKLFFNSCFSLQTINSTFSPLNSIIILLGTLVLNSSLGILPV